MAPRAGVIGGCCYKIHFFEAGIVDMEAHRPPILVVGDSTICIRTVGQRLHIAALPAKHAQKHPMIGCVKVVVDVVVGEVRVCAARPVRPTEVMIEV